LSRTLNAPVELVWEMWTDPEHIENWWGPDGFTNTINAMDVKPGGEWDLVMHGPDGTNYDNKSVFQEVAPFQKIVFEHLTYPRSVTTVTFEERGDRTLLTWHMLFESAEVFRQVVREHGAVEGMKQNVAKLETYLGGLMATTRPQAKPTGHYAEVNGIRMYYEIEGSGSPLVLLHGGGSTIRTSFGRIMPELANTHQVIAIELQAHGHTGDRAAPETFEQDAADVVELLRQLKVGQADVLGFSNGGHTALEIAIRHPARFRRLIVASAFYKRSGVPEVFWQGLATAKLSDMPQLYQDEFLSITHSPAGLQNMFDKDVRRMVHFTGWTDEDIRSIQAPTLIVAGDRDAPTPEHTVAMYRLLPQGRLVILPGYHGEYMGEALFPNASNERVSGFVAMVNEFLGG